MILDPILVSLSNHKLSLFPPIDKYLRNVSYLYYKSTIIQIIQDKCWLDRKNFNVFNVN